MIGILSTLFLYLSGAHFLLSYLAKRSIFMNTSVCLLLGTIQCLCPACPCPWGNNEWSMTVEPNDS